MERRDNREPAPSADVGGNPTNNSSIELSVLLGVIQDDIRHVHVRVTAAIAIAAVFVTQIPLGDLQTQPGWARVLTFVAIVALSLAAAFYFQYTQELNKLRLRIVAERVSATDGSAVATWSGQFRGRGGWRAGNLWFFRLGQALLLVGSVCVGIVLCSSSCSANPRPGRRYESLPAQAGRGAGCFQ